MKRRLLVLLSETFANGGIQRFNRTLLAAIETLGLDCDVFSLADDAQSREKWFSQNSPVRVRTFARNKAAFAAATVRAILSGRYDDVIVGHVHFLELAVSGRLIRRRTRLLLVAHGVEVWGRLQGERRRSLSGVDRILCVSEYTAQSMREQAPEIPPERFTVFPNALADLWVAKADRLAEEALPTRGDRFILAVARLSHHDRLKGIITTLEAFAQLADRELRFVIAGDGDDLEFLRGCARRLGVAERVEFAGAVSDSQLVGLYRGCQAFVLPSGQEGFGIVFLEAMYFGAPVIAASVKGALDVVRDGETGLLVPYGDVVALAGAITRICRDGNLRDQLTRAARANVTQEGCFTASAFTRRIGQLLTAQPPPRKLVLVNRYFAPDESATSRLVSDLARRLKSTGVLVVALSSRQLYDNAAADLPEYQELDGVIVHRVGGTRLGRGRLWGRALDYLSFHWAAYWRLRRLLTVGDVVVAKTDPPMLSVTVGRAARARGALQVNWLQDVFPEVARQLGVVIRPAWLGNFLQAMRNTSLRRAAGNVVIGTRMSELIAAQGVAPELITVIPNWADVDAVQAHCNADNKVRQRLELSDRFVIGYSGNLGRAHEFDTFLGAALLLRDAPEFVFLVTGGGAKIAALRQQADDAGLESFRFQPLQPAADLADNMAAADVHLVSLLPETEGLIVPSKYYGIMAAGRPAIFIGDTDGELAREIRLSGTGVVIAVGDSTALAAELRALRADPQRCVLLGDNARRAAEQRHSSQRAVKAWLALLAKLAPRTAQPDVPALMARSQSGT